MLLLLAVVVFGLERGLHLSLSDAFASGLAARWERVQSALGGMAGVILIIVLPVLLLGVLRGLLSDRPLSVLRMLIDLLPLFLALGSAALREAVTALEKQGDAAFWGQVQPRLQAAGLQRRESWNRPSERVRDLAAQIFYRNLQVYFVVLFWFLLAGGPGALLVALAAVAERRSEPSRRVGMILSQVLEWLPVRLFGLSALLLGQGRGLLARHGEGLVLLSPDRRLVSEALVAGHERPLVAVRGLLGRVLLLWFGVALAWTLALHLLPA